MSEKHETTSEMFEKTAATHRYIGNDAEHTGEAVIYLGYDQGDCLHRVANAYNEEYYVSGNALGPL